MIDEIPGRPNPICGEVVGWRDGDTVVRYPGGECGIYAPTEIHRVARLGSGRTQWRIG